MIASPENGMLELAAEPGLFSAWEQVAQKSSAPGIDHVDVHQFSRTYSSELRRLHDELVRETYEPKPLITFPVEKEDRGIRELTIATVRDRIVARRLANYLAQRHDSELQPQSYAYRRGKGALRAVAAVERAAETAAYALRVDIRTFFDEIAHDTLADTLRRMGESESVVGLALRIARAPRFDGARLTVPNAGVPQGSPAAPVLSNLYLDGLDRMLNREGYAFVRYADDLVVFANDADDANRALGMVQSELGGLHLAVSINKTRVYRIDDGFLFLGFLFSRRGHAPSQESRRRLREKLGEGQYDDETDVQYRKRREAIERGWNNYFQPPPAPESGPEPKLLPPASPPALAAPAEVDSFAAGPAETPCGDSPAAPHFADELQRIRDLLDLGRAAEAIRLIRARLGNDEDHLPSALRSELADLLARAYENQGLHGAAAACRMRDADPSAFPSPAERPVHGARDVEIWLETFGAPAGKIYAQYLDRAGRTGFRPFRNALDGPLLAAHWEGRHTLSVPVHAPDDAVRFCLLDLDVTRKTLDELDAARLDEYRHRLLDDARGLLALARQAGVEGLLEDSGYKGYHVWFFFHAALPAELGLSFLQELCRMAGPAPEGTHREFFPGSARRPADGLGARIKLPLGRHLATGRFSRFLAPDGQPCEHGIQLLRPSLRNKAAALRDAVRRWTLYRPAEPPAAHEPAAPQGATDRTENPADSVAALFAGCAVLSGLRAKARAEGFLSHYERMVVRGILSPLGPEGRKAIHDVVRPCRNYSQRTTDSMIGSRDFPPMPCRRIQEILGTFCNQVGCDCRFRTSAKSPATPLNLLRASRRSASGPERPAGASFPASATTRPEPSPARPVPAKAHESTPVAPAKSPAEAQDLLRRYHALRGEIRLLNARLAQLCPDGRHVQLDIGTLRHETQDSELGRWILEL